jgi:hypothetical protein
MSIISIVPLFEAMKLRRSVAGVLMPSAFGWKAMPPPWPKVEYLPLSRCVNGWVTLAK